MIEPTETESPQTVAALADALIAHRRRPRGGVRPRRPAPRRSAGSTRPGRPGTLLPTWDAVLELAAAEPFLSAACLAVGGAGRGLGASEGARTRLSPSPGRLGAPARRARNRLSPSRAAWEYAAAGRSWSRWPRPTGVSRRFLNSTDLGGQLAAPGVEGSNRLAAGACPTLPPPFFLVNGFGRFPRGAVGYSNCRL